MTDQDLFVFSVLMFRRNRERGSSIFYLHVRIRATSIWSLVANKSCIHDMCVTGVDWFRWVQGRNDERTSVQEKKRERFSLFSDSIHLHERI